MHSLCVDCFHTPNRISQCRNADDTIGSESDGSETTENGGNRGENQRPNEGKVTEIHNCFVETRTNLSGFCIIDFMKR